MKMQLKGVAVAKKKQTNQQTKQMFLVLNYVFLSLYKTSIEWLSVSFQFSGVMRSDFNGKCPDPWMLYGLQSFSDPWMACV